MVLSRENNLSSLSLSSKIISPLSLPTLPDLAILCIAEHCDYNTQLSLSLVCTHTRDLTYSPLLVFTSISHRIKNITQVMQKILRALVLWVLAVIVCLVVVLTCFFGLVILMGNNFTEEGKRVDLVIIVPVTITTFTLIAIFCWLLLALTRMHYSIVAQAKLCHIVLYPLNVINEGQQKTSKISEEMIRIEVDLEAAQKQIDDLKKVEKRLKTLPWWWQIPTTIFG